MNPVSYVMDIDKSCRDIVKMKEEEDNHSKLIEKNLSCIRNEIINRK
jgi:hypothetical protein